MSAYRILFLATIQLAILAGIARGQAFEIPWNTIDGGGAMNSASGVFQLYGTIGQPDATSFSAPLSGGAFQLVGGFWPVAASVCTCPGDMNGDTLRDGGDIRQFVACAFAGGNCGCADLNASGGVDAADVSLFVTDLLAGAGCP